MKARGVGADPGRRCGRLFKRTSGGRIDSEASINVSLLSSSHHMLVGEFTEADQMQSSYSKQQAATVPGAEVLNPISEGGDPRYLPIAG